MDAHRQPLSRRRASPPGHPPAIVGHARATPAAARDDPRRASGSGPPSASVDRLDTPAAVPHRAAAHDGRGTLRAVGYAALAAANSRRLHNQPHVVLARPQARPSPLYAADAAAGSGRRPTLAAPRAGSPRCNSGRCGPSCQLGPPAPHLPRPPTSLEPVRPTRPPGLATLAHGVHWAPPPRQRQPGGSKAKPEPRTLPRANTALPSAHGNQAHEIAGTHTHHQGHQPS